MTLSKVAGSSISELLGPTPLLSFPFNRIVSLQHMSSTRLHLQLLSDTLHVVAAFTFAYCTASDALRGIQYHTVGAVASCSIHELASMQQDKRDTPLKVFWELAMMRAWIVTYFDPHLANHISHIWAYSNTCLFVGKLKQKANMVTGLSFELPKSPQEYWQWHVTRHFPWGCLRASALFSFSLTSYHCLRLLTVRKYTWILIYKDPSTGRDSARSKSIKTFKH